MKSSKLIILILLAFLSVGGFLLWLRFSPKAEIEGEDYVLARTKMVESQLKGRDITDSKVLAVMSRVEREKFVPDSLKSKAYIDDPLPIGFGQTISQPYIVALMTQSLALSPNDKVLEIGTGSGYQAAVLAEITPHVFTVEIVKELTNQAKERLINLGYKTIQVQHGDGYYGWSQEAPFDKIMITAAANHIPPPLIEQLKENGKLIIPLGSVWGFQNLTLITKKNGELNSQVITGVRFVPLTGKISE